MNAPLTYPSLDHDLREVVEAIFDSMLHLPLTTEDRPPVTPANCLNAVIPFKGSWNGVVALRCGAGQGRQLAARFLSLPPEELAETLICDTLGELANMIAGNLKSVFARDIRLSPAAVTCSPQEIELPVPATIEERCCFQSAEGPFCVAVLAAPGEPRLPW